LLGRFAIVLVVLGALLGWIVRAKWGTRPGPRFWWGTFAPAGLHAAYVVQRAVVADVALVAVGGYAVASAALLAAAAGAVRALSARRRGWAAAVPFAHALLHAIATSLLGAAFSAASEAPPVVGPALVVGWSIVAASAWAVVLVRVGRPRWRRRRGGTAAPASDAPARLDP
jgi:hypothetical protein